MGANVAVGDLVDGKYRIIRTIGEGGWGIVFEGENVRTYKRCAIKILRTSSAVTKDILTRFEREAQAAGRIGSEHIVEVYDLGVLEDGTHYMVMELLTGQELAQRLRAGGPLDPVIVAKFTLQLLEGLKAAHEAGILHRDLKPENLFLVPTRTGEEFVKILDFGISKFNVNGPQQQSATMTGAVLGSPCYMAPEQARGLKQVDARTDLYAVGTLMFESLTGRVPFVGENFNDLMFKIVLAPRPDPRELRPDLDPEMALIVVKAMAIDPQHRYQNAEEMSAALTQWLAARGIHSVRPPELKRVTQHTPRGREGGGSTPQAQPRMATPVEKATVNESHSQRGAGTPPFRDAARPAQWSDATLPAEQSGTPLAASSPSGVPAATRASGGAGRSRATVAVIAAAVAVAAILGVAAFMRGEGTKATAAVTADPPATAHAATTASSPPSPAASLAPPPDTAPPATTEVASATPPPSSAAPARSAAAPAFPARTAVAAGAPIKRAGAASAAAKPADTAAAAATAKPVSTVEGREIRTGL